MEQCGEKGCWRASGDCEPAVVLISLRANLGDDDRLDFCDCVCVFVFVFMADLEDQHQTQRLAWMDYLSRDNSLALYETL